MDKKTDIQLNFEMKTIYEDSDIIVVNKPHGLHTVEDRHGLQKDTLRSILDNQFGKIYIVHRLDAGTGGIIVCAKNPGAHRNLCMQFEHRQVYKEYIAVVSGRFEYPVTVLLPLSPKIAHGKYRINFKSGRPAQTSFIPLKTGDVSVVKVIPHTGRSHQIRVHLKAHKCPLYNDRIYNPEQYSGSVLSLFAFKLTFLHPETALRMELEAELSDYMKELINKAGGVDA